MKSQSTEFQIIGHRGAAGHAPENTLPGFDLAVRLGVDAIEFDLHLSRDGVPVVIHDATVDRTTDGNGRVSELTSAELKALDAGVGFDEAYAGTRIPFLDEVLARRHGLPLVIEIKEVKRTAELLERLFEALRDAPATEVIISSFIPEALEEALRQHPGMPRALLVRQDKRALDGLLKEAESLQLAQICPWAPAIDPAWVRRVKESGYDVRSWGLPGDRLADLVKAMRGILRAGVSGATADYPDLMRTACMVDSDMRSRTIARHGRTIC